MTIVSPGRAGIASEERRLDGPPERLDAVCGIFVVAAFLVTFFDVLVLALALLEAVLFVVFLAVVFRALVLLVVVFFVGILRLPYSGSFLQPTSST